MSGQCDCFTEYGGTKCDKKCPAGYYGIDCSDYNQGILVLLP